jgi:hypothetical protein
MRRYPQLIALAALLLAACGGGVEAAELGTEVEVGHLDSSTNTSTTLALTVTAVRQGTIEELEAAGLEFDPEERNLIPHYVDATYTNTGDGTVERSMRVAVEDGDDNLISPTVIFDFSGGEGGDSGPCVGIDDGPLAPGESFEDCTLFLVEEGREVARVSFLSQPEDGESEFVYWKAE